MYPALKLAFLIFNILFLNFLFNIAGSQVYNQILRFGIKPATVQTWFTGSGEAKEA